MKRFKFFEITALVIILALTGVSAISCASAASKNKLEGVTWTLYTYGDPSNPTAVVSGSTVTLTFDKAKMTVSGNGGVNGYGGDYTVNGNKLTISHVIHTMIASTNEALNQQESKFFNILQSAQSYSIADNVLTINGTQGTLELIK